MIETIVKNQNSLSILGTTSSKAAQSFTSTHADTRLYTAQSVNAKDEFPPFGLVSDVVASVLLHQKTKKHQFQKDHPN